jgi:TRAP transporter 4TM/12TM fusion protein
MSRWYRKGVGLGLLFEVGVRRRPTGWLAHVVTPFAALLAVWVITAATVVIVAPWTLAVTVLTAMMTLAFIGVGARAGSNAERPSPIDWLLSAAALACGIYFTLHAGEIEQRVILLDPLTTWDVVFAATLFFLTIEITRRTTGLGLTLVVLVFVAYNLLGHRLGGVLKHGYIDVFHFLEITVFTTDGILGLPVRVAATYAFLFVLFGTVLLHARGGDFFFDLAAALAGKRPGGPAKIAVVSSGVYGMVSGSPTSDVVTTGSITIPIMKRLGYQGRLAAAVEVAASTGGSLAPPVMGAAAFIMAEYTGIDYAAIAVAALIPALLYYLSVYAQVHFRSLKLGLKPLEPELIPRLTPTLKSGGLFLVPLIVITVALLIGYTPTIVAVYGTIAILAVAVLRTRTRVGPVKLYKALAETAFRMIPVAGACAAAGLVIAGITMTGLAAKFAHVVYAMTDAQVFPALIVAAALTIVLGLGMPTPSAYILAAMLMGPLMVQLKIPTLGGHMFLLYFAVMSAITPPVAVAAYAASSIAEDNPLAIAGLAVKFALAAFVVPFVFVFAPSLLWNGPLWKTAVVFVTAAIALIVLAAAIERFSKWCDSWWSRLLLAAGALFLIAPPLWAVGVGAVLVVIAIGGDRLVGRRGAAGSGTG